MSESFAISIYQSQWKRSIKSQEELGDGSELPSRSLLYYGIDDRSKNGTCGRNLFSIRTPRKRLHPSDSKGGSSKKSLEDFNQMVESCEGSFAAGERFLKVLVNRFLHHYVKNPAMSAGIQNEVEVVGNLARSKSSSRSGLDEKIKLLEQLERELLSKRTLSA
ncbi:hypothetical protein IFM89_008531 [Coptis chinensis]|uniref:Uncharacterized protein n=1 Tax=Coptis chinensis TaxID=261450 RepID=A0A835M2F4_9MAGN|nr:hypothetical protein IFM89_008531 [Coptis chinensis]